MAKTEAKSNIVGLKELRHNMDRYIDRVSRGESFTVIRRASPVFRISAPENDDSLWETVADFTKIKKSGISSDVVLGVLKRLNEQDRKISKKAF